MKLKLLLSCLLLCVLSASAQDVITLIDGSSIEAKVEEITDVAVKYRKFANLSGPVYSIKLEKVSKIAYHNGATDVFNSPTVTPQANTQLNEAELLRMAEFVDYEKIESVASQKYVSRAKRYKWIGWIGGGVLVAAGFGLSYALEKDSNSYATFYKIGAPIAVAGVIWCVSWNVAANKQMKKARMAEVYSEPVAETELLRMGKNRLIGSVNVMGNNLMHSRAFGLGLKFNF